MNSLLPCGVPFQPPILPRVQSWSLEACAPLLEILEDETVQVIHHSFTEFLLDVTRVDATDFRSRQFPVLNTLQAHRILAVTCLNYMQAGGLRESKVVGIKGNQVHEEECDSGDWPCDCPYIPDDPFDYQIARIEFPFLEYAVKNWTLHSCYYDIYDEGFFHLMSKFLDSNNVDFRRWLVLEWKTEWYSVSNHIPSLLHIAAFAGLTSYTSVLLQMQSVQVRNIQPLDSESRTPLHWASRRDT